MSQRNGSTESPIPRMPGDRLAGHPLMPVRYDGKIVALIDSERAWLVPEVSLLEEDHPHKRFVLVLCLAAHEIQSGESAELHWEALAESCAREILVPEKEFLEHWAEADTLLAERFNVPLEQIRQRRSELGVQRSSREHVSGTPFDG